MASESINYIHVEKNFNRVSGALKSIADSDTNQSLNQIGFVVAELRHASVCLEEGTSKEEVIERLMANLFNKTN